MAKPCTVAALPTGNGAFGNLQGEKIVSSGVDVWLAGRET